jgi:thioredoxin reductase
MITYSKLKSKLNEQQNIVDRFVVGECLVVITKDLEISVNEECIGSTNSLEEARLYASKYVSNKKIVEQINTVIPEEKLVSLIQKHHNIHRITDSLIESYIELASSNIFSVDPVVTEIKQNSIEGKFQYVLDDGSIVAINETTQEKLSNYLSDKYQIVEHMRKSKDNFMNAIRELKE